MKVKFTLTMTNAVVDSKEVNSIEFTWVEQISVEEMLQVSHRWMTSENFLTTRMTGLSRVGESQLTVEPFAE